MSSKVSVIEPAETPVSVSAREKALLLKTVAEKHGGVLRPDDVVREADPDNKEGIAHRLASLVGWNTSEPEAAHRWRVDQARLVIRSCEPELIQMGVMTIRAPHYVRDPQREPREQGYAELLSIKTREEVAADLLVSEIDRAVAGLERAYSIATALGREQEIADLAASLAALGRAPGVIPAAEGASASASQ